MKAHIKKAMGLSFIFAVAIAAPVLVQAIEAGPVFGRASSDTDKVSGKVEAKTTDSLSVNGHTVQVTNATTITKEGAPIKIGDVNVGDKVSAVTVKSSDGRLLAVSIEVISVSAD
jgi:hypothetical protein